MKPKYLPDHLRPLFALAVVATGEPPEEVIRNGGKRDQAEWRSVTDQLTLLKRLWRAGHIRLNPTLISEEETLG